MPPELPPRSRPDSHPVEWTSALDGLWVAAVCGGYAGSVAHVANVFTTRTDLGVIIDTFTELAPAQRALVAHVCHPLSKFFRSPSPSPDDADDDADADDRIRPPRPYRRGVTP